MINLKMKKPKEMVREPLKIDDLVALTRLREVVEYIERGEFSLNLNDKARELSFLFGDEIFTDHLFSDDDTDKTFD